VLVLVALLSLTLVPVAPLLDSYGMTISERFGQSYGSLRVWGSVGYMALTLVLGWLMGDRVSSLLLVAYAVCLGCTMVAVFGLPHLAQRRPRPLLSGLSEVRHNQPLVLLLIVAYLLSSGAAIMGVFLGIHVQELGGSANLVGIAFAISAASELPIVAFGGWFLTRFGALRLIALALVVYAVRLVALSLISDPDWILPIQALHGLSYGAFLMASVTLAYRSAGREQAATAQALLTTVSFGFGSITGSLIGGALLDSIGTVGLFQGAAVLMVITLGILLAGDRIVGLDRSPQGQ
jgi:PPP family 3-phenylpropionic acid transporter